jgi:hypothetical protein
MKESTRLIAGLTVVILLNFALVALLWNGVSSRLDSQARELEIMESRMADLNGTLSELRRDVDVAAYHLTLIQNNLSRTNETFQSELERIHSDISNMNATLELVRWKLGFPSPGYRPIGQGTSIIQIASANRGENYVVVELLWPGQNSTIREIFVTPVGGTEYGVNVYQQFSDSTLIIPTPWGHVLRTGDVVKVVCVDGGAAAAQVW